MLEIMRGIVMQAKSMSPNDLNIFCKGSYKKNRKCPKKAKLDTDCWLWKLIYFYKARLEKAQKRSIEKKKVEGHLQASLRITPEEKKERENQKKRKKIYN